MTSSESHLDIWPLSERLKKVLEERRSEQITYTMPGVKHVVLFTEPLSSAASLIFERYLNEPDPEMNQQGFLALLNDGHLEAALVSTSTLLSQLGQGLGMAGKRSTNSDQTFQIWATRFQLMLSLGKYSQLVEELTPFEELDAPDLFYEYHNENSPKKGSMVPFTLRLVHAEALRHTPFPWKSADRILKLEKCVISVIQNLKDEDADTSAIADWEKRLQSVIKLKIRTLYHLEEYGEAMRSAEELRLLATDDETRISTGCAMVRMAIASGDEKSAEKTLTEAATIMNEKTVTLHKAYRAIFHGSFPHARDYIQRLENLNFSSPQMHNTDAVCQLYLGNASESVEVLSKLEALSRPMQTNLVTLAELVCSTSERQKILEDSKEKPLSVK